MVCRFGLLGLRSFDCVSNLMWVLRVVLGYGRLFSCFFMIAVLFSIGLCVVSAC